VSDLSDGVGKRPASSREHARYNRRDRSSPRPTARIGGHGTDSTGDRPADAITSRPAGPPAGAVPGRGPATAPLTAKTIRRRRSTWTWRRANRRITVESRSLAVWLGERLAALGRRLLIVAKVLAAVAILAGALFAGRLGVTHVVASPRFSLREIRVGPTTHVSRDDIVARSGVSLGSRLLTLDTDQIAARLARHPWIAAARVRRELPAALVIDVTERHAAAVAVIGALYLLDERGHPFKHATLDEADGQIVLTGISRAQYAGLPRASEAAFREALALHAEYQRSDGATPARQAAGGVARPALSEIHIDPHTGFSLFLYDGGAQIRLGRGDIAGKLDRLDKILAEFGPRSFANLRTIYLDGAANDRVPIRLAPGAAETQAAPKPTP
jgi:cell division protein FtsQ